MNGTENPIYCNRPSGPGNEWLWPVLPGHPPERANFCLLYTSIVPLIKELQILGYAACD